jgi:hypothetical protein
VINEIEMHPPDEYFHDEESEDNFIKVNHCLFNILTDMS